MLYWCQDLSFDNDGEEGDPIYICTFEAGDVVKVVHSDVVQMTKAADGANTPFTAIKGRDAGGMFRTVVIPSEWLAPAEKN